MKNEKKKKSNKFYKFIYILLFIVTCIFTAGVYFLKMLPMKYFLVVICFDVFILGLFALIFLNTHVKKVVKFFFLLFALGLMAGMGVGSKYLLSTIGAIDKVTQKINYKTENYSVLVLAKNKYEDISELENLNLGYLDNASEGTSKALKKVKEKVETKNLAYEDVAKLESDLLKEDIDALVVEDSFKQIMDEESEKFNLSTQILYSFSVKVKEEKSSKSVDVTKEPFNVYITGIDTYGKISSVSRSDVNIIATVNPTTKKVLLTSIPRDYYVPLKGMNGAKDKLTHAGIYGVEKSIGTIEDLLDIKINYYVKVNFTSVENIVDTLGGITVHSDYSFVSKDGYKYTKGDNKVNGKRALSFARERYSFNDGDIQRGKNQIYVIEAIADKLMSFKSVANYEKLLDTIEGNFETNLSNKDISNFIKMQIDDMQMFTIESNSLKGTGSKESTYTYKSSKSYVMLPDNASVASAKTKISKIVNES